MVKGVALGDKDPRFAPTPWTTASEEWQAIDQRLPANHLARCIDRAIGMLDLGPLFDSYLGVGKKALRPDLLLKAVLYEMQNNRPSPAQWARDVRENEPLRWLLFGMKPSRARLYDFRDRIAPFLQEWNAQVLEAAIEEKMTSATRVALDSSSVAAHASRRGLLNEERLQKRQQVIVQRLRQIGDEKPAVAVQPGWLAGTLSGLRRQAQRFAQAARVLLERQAANARRPAAKRKPNDKILLSATDPEAVLGRDKLNVFRPLYNLQVLRDLDSPLVLAYDVLAQINENGVVEPMIEQMVENVGCKPRDLLVDSGYISLEHLEFCDGAGITAYGPWQENDFSEQHGKRKQHNQHTQLPKSAFPGWTTSKPTSAPRGTA